METGFALSEIDYQPDRPGAGMYDALPGGKDNYPADGLAAAGGLRRTHPAARGRTGRSCSGQ